MKTFNDAIPAGKLGRESNCCCSLAALSHPVSERSGLKSRSGPLDQSRCSGLSTNHMTWFPKKVSVARSHSKGMTKFCCQLCSTPAHTYAQQHHVLCSSMSAFRFIWSVAARTVCDSVAACCHNIKGVEVKSHEGCKWRANYSLILWVYQSLESPKQQHFHRFTLLNVRSPPQPTVWLIVFMFELLFPCQTAWWIVQVGEQADELGAEPVHDSRRDTLRETERREFNIYWHSLGYRSHSLWGRANRPPIQR